VEVLSSGICDGMFMGQISWLCELSKKGDQILLGNALMHKTFCLNILEWFAKALIFLELWPKSLKLM
jgi:hypothetical protein